MFISEFKSPQYTQVLQDFNLINSIQKKVQNPLVSRVSTPDFDKSEQITFIPESLTDYLLFISSTQLKQVCCKCNIEFPLDKFTFEDVQKYQEGISVIDTSELKSVPANSMNSSNHIAASQIRQSATSNYTFKTFINSKKISNNTQYCRVNMATPKIHDCSIVEQKIKYNIPTQYRNIESQYSPSRLPLYLNKNHPSFSTNQKWLNYGVTQVQNTKKPRSKTNETFDQIYHDNEEQLKKSMTKTHNNQLISLKHRDLMNQSVDNVQFKQRKQFRQNIL